MLTPEDKAARVRPGLANLDEARAAFSRAQARMQWAKSIHVCVQCFSYVPPGWDHVCDELTARTWKTDDPSNYSERPIS